MQQEVNAVTGLATSVAELSVTGLLALGLLATLFVARFFYLEIRRVTKEKDEIIDTWVARYEECMNKLGKD